MDKKESPNPESDFKPKSTGGSGKLSGIASKAFGVTKFIFGICLLPFVYSVSIAFLKEFSLIQKPLQYCFWSGVISLLVIYLFIWEPVIIYTKGHKILEALFNFFKPLLKVAPYLLPIYTIVLFILYGLLSLVITAAWLLEYALFLFGFSLILHLVFSAKTMRSKKEDFLKGNYIFGFSFVYIINIALFALSLNLIFQEFSFVNFSNGSFHMARDIFYAVFKQLFLK